MYGVVKERQVEREKMPVSADCEPGLVAGDVLRYPEPQLPTMSTSRQSLTMLTTMRDGTGRKRGGIRVRDTRGEVQ